MTRTVLPLLLALALPIASRADTPPLSAYARLPLVARETLSPDGTRMACLMSIKGQEAIGVIKLTPPAEPPVMLPVPDGTEVRWLHWANDDNVVLGLDALRFFKTGDWYISRAAALSVSKRKLTSLLADSGGQNAANVFWYPHDGGSRVLIGAQQSIYMGPDFYPAVFEVDVATGHAVRRVEPHEGIMHWRADADGTVRAGVGYDDFKQSLRLIYRSGSSDPFRMIDHAALKKDESLLQPFLFLSNDHALTIHGDAQHRDGIYEVDLATLTDVRTVYQPSNGEVTGAILDAAGQTLLGTYTDSFFEPIHWFDETLAGYQARFSRSFPDDGVTITSMSADRRRMLVRVGAADAPGLLYLFDTLDDRLTKVATINEAVGPRHLAPVKVVHYKARDGLPIEAILTLPEGRPATHLPLVVFPHGGPWAQDTPEWNFIAQFVASRGYAVLQPNFRGSTGYGREFERKGEGQLGLAMQDDVTDGVRWAAGEGLADPKRVCILGGSYGGYTAMWGIVRDPDLYRCAISFAGVSGLKREVRSFYDYVSANRSIDEWKRMTPDFDAVSPINFVERIQTPLLLVHGQKDVTVPFEQSQHMYDRMKRAGKSVELLPLPLADHHYGREADRTSLLTAIGDFLAKYNPAD